MKVHLKCIGPEAHRLLLNLLKMMMNMNRKNTCTYEPFHIRIDRSAFVADIDAPNCRDLKLGGDVYVKDTERSVIKRIFPCHVF